MRLLQVLRLKWRALVRGGDVDRDDRDEMQAHLDYLAQEYVAGGMAPADARARALREFGGVAALQEQARDARGLRWLIDAAQDGKYGLRMLRRTPGFAAAAILTLALGIGANTAILSLADTVLLREVPVSRPQELVFVNSSGGGTPPYPYFDRLRHESTSFAGIAAVASDQLRVEVDGRVEQVLAQIASGNYFEMLGVRPAAGRLFTLADESLDPAVAVIGYGYWQRRFGGDPSVIGKNVVFGAQSFRIVGVTPKEFWGLDPGHQIELTLPITEARDMLANTDTWGWYGIVARLKPERSVAQATAESDAIYQSFLTASNQTASTRRKFPKMSLSPAGRGTDGLRTRFGRPLYALAGIAAIVLIIACVNVANLLLARGVARSREFAVRVATGAGRGRLLRQALTETLLLFALGAVAGLVVAPLSIRGLVGFFAIGRNPIILDVHVDWRLPAIAMAIALAAGIVTGLWPAFGAVRTDPQAAMKDGEGRLAGSGRVASAGQTLVGAQIALSLVMLVTAVIFVRTMMNLRHVDLGFTERHVLTMSLDVANGDDAEAERKQLWSRALEGVRGVPGVRSVSMSVLTPLSGRDSGRQVTVAGYQPRLDSDRGVHLNHVTEDYFRTFGIPLMAGRAFTPLDTAGARKVAVINEATARAFFGGRSPIGASLGFGARGSYEIVGVVRDYKHMSLRQPVPRFVFVPIDQPIGPVTRVTLAVASDQPAAATAAAVTRIVRAANPQALVSDVISVEEQIDATLVSERLLSTLAAAFAVLALGLAAIGLYGVLGYSVARRRPEFGVRMALGGRPGRVARDVVRSVLPQLGIGLAAGLVMAVIMARAAAGMLFGVAPGDAANYAIATPLLVVVALVAAWIPARRATKIDPVAALRRD